MCWVSGIQTLPSMCIHVCFFTFTQIFYRQWMLQNSDQQYSFCSFVMLVFNEISSSCIINTSLSYLSFQAGSDLVFFSSFSQLDKMVVGPRGVIVIHGNFLIYWKSWSVLVSAFQFKNLPGRFKSICMRELATWFLSLKSLVSLYHQVPVRKWSISSRVRTQNISFASIF